MEHSSLSRIAARVVQKLPEAPGWAPFGQFAWANFREGIPSEPDTELESQMFADLKAHFSNQRVGLPIQTSNLLQMFMWLGWYKPVLHPPPYKTLYRGLKLRGKSALAEFLSQPIESIPDEGHLDLESSISISSLNGHSTSWSAKKIITRDFSNRGKLGYACTLIADVEQNPYKFLAGPGGLYDVVGISSYHLEKETVGLEPVLVRRIEWERL